MTVASVTRSPSIGEQEDLSIGAAAWNFPERITAEDGSCTYVSGVTFDSHWIRGRAFGFTIPSNATIKGIEVGFKYRASREYLPGGRGSMVLGVDGVLSGTWYKDNAFAWTANTTMPPLHEGLLGGPTDTWGPAMTPAQINGAGFCAGIGFTADPGGGVTQIDVDVMRVTVYYEVPPTVDQWMEF